MTDATQTEQNKYSNDTQIAVLAERIFSVVDLVAKLSATVEKLINVTAEQQQDIALTNLKLENNQKSGETLAETVENHRKTLASTVEKDRETLAAMVEKNRETLAVLVEKQREIFREAIDSSHEDLSDRINGTETRIVALLEAIKNDRSRDIIVQQDVNSITDGRLGALEKWKWLLVGAGAALGGFIAYILPPFLQRVFRVFG